MKLDRWEYYTLGCTSLVIGTGILLNSMYGLGRENAKKPSCQSNLKQIALGVFQYSQDYDEKYPLVAVSDTHISEKNPYGWVDALQPYLKSTQIFQCPNHPLYQYRSRPTGFQARGINDYYFNSRIAGVSPGKLNNIAGTIMTAHGNDGIDYANARYSKRSLPAHGRGDDRSPAHHQ